MGDPAPAPLSQMLAAAINNSSPVKTTTTGPPPSWRLELMMEKLRQKRGALKPLQETAKNLRQALMERRCFLDANDRTHLQKCLDSLQQSIKVNSLSSMVERLDMVSRQLGLKLSPGANEQEWFISSDMFYLEVLIDSSGVVRDLKIQHEGKTEQLQCPDLIKSLEAQDFNDFAAHLQGLIDIYSLTADKHIKSKAFIALQAMETDLAAMATTYSHETKADQIVMKHLLGHFQPRRGGHPVKLTYYISPYEFIDKESKTCIPNDINEIVKRQIGTWATVCIQGSPGINRKLQMNTTVTVHRNPEGKAMPRYGTLNSTNSTALPASFELKFAKEIPIFKGLLNSIQAVTGIENGTSDPLSHPMPILNLITQVISGNQLDCSEEKGLFVTLPDQEHCYFMTETAGLEGVKISSIKFTLASQLPQLIVILRQQLMFNTLVGSCVRLCSKPGTNSIVFELSALSHHNLSVSFQHPLDDSLVTLEFDIRDVMLPQCRVHALYSTTPDMIPTLEEHACTVVRRSMSIPVTVRAVIRRWQSMKIKSDVPKPDSLIPAPSTSNSGSINPLLPVSAPSCGLESQQNQPSSFKQCMNYNAPAQTTPIDFISYMTNPIFASLTQNFQSTKNGQGALGTGAHGVIPNASMLQGLLDQNNPAKRRKRNKTSTELQKSPVRQKSPIRPEDPQGGSSAPGWMSDLGLEQDCRWNIDITPVGTSAAAEELKRKFPVKRSVSLDSNVESDDRMPSLSITPVNATAGTSTTVNSLLASIRPGIEIIPLPNPQNPPTIPNSITVTPILPGSTDIKKINKKRPEDMIEKKKIKRLDVKHVNKLQQQGGKPSMSTMKSVSTLSKPKKLIKPSLDITKKTDPNKIEKDKSLVIYQPPKTQAATQAVAAALAAAKTGITKKGTSLDSVINKLKMQSAAATDVDGGVVKKEQMSTKDLLKASSSITDIIQKNQSKAMNEYSVKSSSGLVPGGGLKLTINKSLTAAKFDLKKKSSVLKRPLGQKTKVSSAQLKDEPKRPMVKKEEMNKITDTRKLYMPTLEPGAMFKDTPKFDLKNFQIPKKSKPVEKIDTPPSVPTPPMSFVEKNNPELTVEAINPPTQLLMNQTTPQLPPRQPTPQPNTSTSTPIPPIASISSVLPPQPIVTPSVSTSISSAGLSSNISDGGNVSSKNDDIKINEHQPTETPTLPPPPPLLPLVLPIKETVISPESPEPMDTSETMATPQNIPTTPPDAVQEPTDKSSESESTGIPPPRATTPAPPPRSVTPAPARSTTPAPIIPPSANSAPPASTNPTSQPPATVDKTSEDSQPTQPLPPPQVADASPILSVHCIVKSPAPNSPAMLNLRSPALIVQSPHTPFMTDDDLMDEALIGGAPSNPDKTS